ncbi:MAG: 50S ribosomal protein L5 [Omnitrophica WOR_2 bacterium SM23_29]|nr:MAG: 50S ribosomal protein L5 [Omnitrophica WOR_2 bacterium SM23_29]
MKVETSVPRLLEKYRKQVVPQMMERFNYKNRFQLPQLIKIVINMGVGQGAQDIKVLEAAANDLATITGQKPIITRAKKAIANFKIKKGSPIGCKVTLRGAMMYEFFDRLINVALPRIRDFRGISPDAFDQSGNYALGIFEQAIFPEIEYDKVQRVQGMDIIIVTNAKSAEEARELLRFMGMPFRK